MGNLKVKLSNIEHNAHQSIADDKRDSNVAVVVVAILTGIIAWNFPHPYIIIGGIVICGIIRAVSWINRTNISRNTSNIMNYFNSDDNHGGQH